MKKQHLQAKRRHSKQYSRHDKQQWLFQAVSYGEVAEARQAIGIGAEVNVISGDKLTINQQQSLLFLAAQQGCLPMVALLVEHGAKMNPVTMDGFTPLMVACQEGHAEVVEFLLKQPGIDVNYTDSTGESALFLAAGRGHEAIVHLLLAHRANPKQAKQDGTTPFFIAAEKGHIEVLQLLLDQAADIHQMQTKQRVTPLQVAAAAGQTEVVKLLIRWGADPNDRDSHGQDAYGYAARSINKTAVFAALQGYQTTLLVELKLLLDHWQEKFPPDTPASRWLAKFKQVVSDHEGRADKVYEGIKALLETLSDPDFSSAKEECQPLRKALRQLMTDYQTARAVSEPLLPPAWVKQPALKDSLQTLRQPLAHSNLSSSSTSVPRPPSLRLG